MTTIYFVTNYMELMFYQNNEYSLIIVMRTYALSFFLYKKSMYDSVRWKKRYHSLINTALKRY